MSISATIPKCGSCGGMILDRFILKVVDQPWHSKCLTCAVCAQPLRDKCFVKNNEVFCREDFFRKYGTKCSGCGEGIAPSSVVRRAQDNVYHVDCFMCVLCNKKLDTGDEFYLMEDKKLLCKQDYDSAKAKGRKIRPCLETLYVFRWSILCFQFQRQIMATVWTETSGLGPPSPPARWRSEKL